VIQRFETGPRMSQAVRAGGLLFVAGQVPDDATGDAAEQTRQVLAKIDRLLEAAGADRTQLVNASIWLKDMADFAAMNSVWDAWVPAGAAPARATVQALLARPDFRVEIAVVAAVPA